MSRTMTGESAYLRGREAFRWRFRRRPYLPGFHRAQWFLGLSDAAVEAGTRLRRSKRPSGKWSRCVLREGR